MPHDRVDPVIELFNHASYPSYAATSDLLGLGRPLDYEPFISMPGVLTFAWGPVVHQLADALGVELEQITDAVERRVSDRTIVMPVGTIEAGDVGALRWELAGIVDGQPRIVIEHVTRMHNDLAPEWPQPSIAIEPHYVDQFGGADGRGQYRVIIEGSPSIRCDLELAEGRDHDFGARVAGVGKLINAIPAVCASAPGLLGALDLPMITGRGLVGSVTGPSPDSRGLPDFIAACG